MTTQGFEGLLHRLAEADVAFILVGGLAVNAWGYLRGTEDIDMVPDQVLMPSAIRTFLRAGDKMLVRTSLGEVGVLQGLPQIPRYEELAARGVDAELGGIRVKVCSLEDLRVMKRAADRPLDRLDLGALEIAHPEE